MRIRSSILSVATAVLLLLSILHIGSAQVPESAETKAQAAAMTLTSEDLPTGYMLTGETFLSLPDPSRVEGVTAHYVSVYTNIDTGQQIRSYVYLFENDDQASQGFDALEDNEASTLTDESADLGSGSAELTTGTYEAADGTVIGTADVTFVRGNAVAGVAVDNPDGTDPNPALATDLAKLSDTIVQQVQSGESALDLKLPSRFVPIADGGVVIQAGFLTAAESEAIYGTQGSVLNSLNSTYVQTVAYGEEGAAPRVTIGVSTFANAEDAKEVVEQADRIFQPLADQETIDDVAMDGVDSVVAYRYTSRDGSIAEQESYRIVFSQDETLTVIDVQEAPDSASAESAANAIAGPQLTCQAGGECVRPVAPGVIPN